MAEESALPSRISKAVATRADACRFTFTPLLFCVRSFLCLHAPPSAVRRTRLAISVRGGVGLRVHREAFRPDEPPCNTVEERHAGLSNRAAHRADAGQDRGGAAHRGRAV